jgi:hypothetical protein
VSTRDYTQPGEKNPVDEGLEAEGGSDREGEEWVFQHYLAYDPCEARMEGEEDQHTCAHNLWWWYGLAGWWWVSIDQGWVSAADQHGYQHVFHTIDLVQGCWGGDRLDVPWSQGGCVWEAWDVMPALEAFVHLRSHLWEADFQDACRQWRYHQSDVIFHVQEAWERRWWVLEDQLDTERCGGNPMEGWGVVSMELSLGSKLLATALFIVEVQGNYSVILGHN